MIKKITDEQIVNELIGAGKISLIIGVLGALVIFAFVVGPMR